MRASEIKVCLDKIIQHFLAIHPVNLDYNNLNKMKHIDFLLESEKLAACAKEYQISVAELNKTKADLKNYFSDILLASNPSLRATVKVVFQAELITSQAAELIIANLLLDDYSALTQSPLTDEQRDKIKAVIAQNTEIKEKYSVFNIDIQHKLSMLGNLCNTALNPWQKKTTEKFQRFIDTNTIQNFNDYEKLIDNFLFFLLEESACFLPSNYSAKAEGDFVAHEKSGNQTFFRLSDNNSLDLEIDEINHFIASYEDYSQGDGAFTHHDASISKTEQARLLFALLDKIKTDKSFRRSIEHLVSELLPKEEMEEEGESTTPVELGETLSIIQNAFNKTLWDSRKQRYCIQSSAQLTGTLPQLLIIHVAQTHACDKNKITNIKEALSLFSTPNYSEADCKVVVLVSSEQELDQASRASSLFSSRESLRNSLSSSPRDSMTSSSPRPTYAAHCKIRHSKTSSSLESSDPKENHKALEKEDIIFRSEGETLATGCQIFATRKESLFAATPPFDTRVGSYIRQSNDTTGRLQRTRKQVLSYTSAATAAAVDSTAKKPTKEESTSSETSSGSLEKAETKPYFHAGLHTQAKEENILDNITNGATTNMNENTTPLEKTSVFRRTGRFAMLLEKREKQLPEDKKSTALDNSIVESRL